MIAECTRVAWDSANPQITAAFDRARTGSIFRLSRLRERAH